MLANLHRCAAAQIRSTTQRASFRPDSPPSPMPNVTTAQDSDHQEVLPFENITEFFRSRELRFGHGAAARRCELWCQLRERHVLPLQLRWCCQPCSIRAASCILSNRDDRSRPNTRRPAPGSMTTSPLAPPKQKTPSVGPCSSGSISAACWRSPGGVTKPQGIANDGIGSPFQAVR